MEAKKLSLGTKLGYGVCDFGGNLFFTATAFVLMIYLTDTVGLAAGLAGLALMVGRLWDAFYDPVIGYASDRTKSRLGRRRPYMLYAAVPLFIAMIIMFTNPALLMGAGFVPQDNQTLLFIWVMVVYIILCTTYSTVNIPYSSLTPEITQDFHERTTLNGYRFGFAVLGTILGASLPFIIIGLFPTKNIGFVALGAIFGAVMMITALITVASVRETAITKPKATAGFFDTYLGVFKNTPYLFILFTYVLHIIAITFVAGIAAYYFKYLLPTGGDLKVAEGNTSIAMGILLLTAMIFIPVSVLVSKKIGKKATYAIGLLSTAVGIMVLFFFGHTQPIAFSFAMMFFMGIGFGFTYAMPYAIVPDAIEYDYLKSGERKEGAYYGIWTWALKLGQAMAALLMGLILQLTKYIEPPSPDVLIEQLPLAKLGIRLLLGPIPASVFVISALVLYFYPINEKRYDEIMAAIKKREGKKG